MKNTLFCFILFALFHFNSLAQKERKPNVILIGVDDLNDWIDPYGGHPQSKTPNIDRLSKKGTTFTHCWPTISWCNPSRVSMLTGIHPLKSGIMLNVEYPFREHLPFAYTLIEKYKDEGYYTVGLGKIFHKDDSGLESWDEYKSLSEKPTPAQFPAHGNSQIIEADAQADWSAIDKPLEDWGDYQITKNAISFLEEYNSSEPFLLALGYRSPHFPWYYPTQFEFSNDDLIMPNDTISNGSSDIALFRLIKKGNQWESAVRSYLSTINFVDYNIGLLLDELERKNYLSNSILIFYSDHGYMLGEKGWWGKVTLWNESLITPLIIITPSNLNSPNIVNTPVNLIDIYPTLMDLCQMKHTKYLDGKSLAHGDQLITVMESRIQYSMTQFGYAVADNTYKYIERDGFKGLYDVQNDPEELYNIKNNIGSSEIILNYKKLLETFQEEHKPFDQPQPPTNLALTTKSNSLELSWHSNNQNSMYELITTDGEYSNIIVLDTNFFYLENKDCLNMTFKVRAFNPKYQSVWSEELKYKNDILDTENSSCELSVFPNPTRDEIKINLGRIVNEQVIVNIFSVNGEKNILINKSMPNKGEVFLNLKHLHSGLYFAHIQVGTSIIIKKIIKL